MTSNQPIKTIKNNHHDQKGHAMASRTIKPGEVILEDIPFVYGPNPGSPPLCLGCFAPIDYTTRCVKCSWPICSLDCPQLSNHETNECEVFAKAKLNFDEIEDFTDVPVQYECITPLRMLLAKERNPEVWEKEVEVLEAYNEERRTKPSWEYYQINVVEFLRGPCKLEQFSEELIHTVCGILDLYCFEARVSSGYVIRCLYPKLSIISHGCVSNVRQTINPDNFKITIRATVEIPENTKLLCSSIYPLWPTLVRRHFLKENKCFDCTCERCQDKTELGTNLSTLKCQKCDNGVILSTEPLSDCCEWKCTHCDFTTNAQAVKKVFDIVQTEIESARILTGPEGIEKRETIFRKYRSVFHPRNAYMTMLRSELIQMYGRVPGYTFRELPDVLQEHKVDLCIDLLEVLNLIEPGLSRIRGITLFEFHAPLIVLARNLYRMAMISVEQLRAKMEEAFVLLEESVEILKYEVPNTLEGQLAVVAQEAYWNLKDNFELLIATA